MADDKQGPGETCPPDSAEVPLPATSTDAAQKAEDPMEEDAPEAESAVIANGGNAVEDGSGDEGDEGDDDMDVAEGGQSVEGDEGDQGDGSDEGDHDDEGDQGDEGEVCDESGAERSEGVPDDDVEAEAGADAAPGEENGGDSAADDDAAEEEDEEEADPAAGEGEDEAREEGEDPIEEGAQEEEEEDESGDQDAAEAEEGDEAAAVEAQEGEDAPGDEEEDVEDAADGVAEEVEENGPVDDTVLQDEEVEEEQDEEEEEDDDEEAEEEDAGLGKDQDEGDVGRQEDEAKDVAAGEKSKAKGDDSESDVELEGIDMEGMEEEEEEEEEADDLSGDAGEQRNDEADQEEGEEEEDEEEEEAKADQATDESMPPPSKGKAKTNAEGSKGGGLAAAGGEQSEDHSFAEVVSQHSKNLEELRERQKGEGATAETRLQYLMQQSEVFTHFLDSTQFGKDKSGNGGKKGTGVRGRMKEQEEDKLLLATAASKARVTRLSKQPSLIKFGTMRAYQLEGLNWMIKLHDNGINGILADEMGLGKTLQSISVLAYLKEDRGINGPHIVIVPKSTVGNWMREFKRWCPSIRTVKLLGSKLERKHVCEEILPLREFDACVASYESVLKEASTLKKIKWRYLLIDEAHRIKNENSSLSKTVRLFHTQFRLLITGTPLQNNLHELWALLNFLLPDVFDSAETFDQWFNLETDKSARDNVIKKLHTILRPFMLRRIKADVEKDLPPKKEVKLYIGMTPMQRKWYKDLLNRDVGNLNTLGGPDKMRLLNILMQLRKVCNHPYLFDGAEPGPPFVNGPHLWENAGKMVLLQKLLPKLRMQGSRVLLFCQMTRLLDILEDYMHLQGYDYCRIDGSTDGESRDSQMDEFNEPGSSKFIFLLSTRAGGLGINLATADVVVLYDSDWNPQVDLQAMDRAHRIGQTKPVKVFRFITEGTVEEKIVERADRKLFLDAAVIQQGRLAEKNASLDKRELMAMVKFGADEILRMDDSQGLTDESIDELLRKGEERTEETNARIQKDMQHNLLTFKIDEEDGISTFLFEGADHSQGGAANGTGAFINLPTRQRKSNYDVNEYYRARMQDKNIPGVRKRKGITMHDFQFFDREAVEGLQAKEHQYADRRNAIISELKELRSRAKRMDAVGDEEDQAAELEKTARQLELTPKEQDQKKKLIDAAFGDWTRKDFRAFVAATERHGRDDTEAVVRDVCLETAKTEENVRKYIKVFWKRCRELADHGKIMEKIEKGEKRIFRSKQIRTAIDNKVNRHTNPWQDLTINYYGGKGKVFTEEEDAFLLNMMHRYGYGNWEVIRMEIRKAWQFRFDWFFKSRNAAELQRRGDTLIRLVEKENEELEQSTGGPGGRKRKSLSAPDTPASSKKKKSSTPASAKKQRRAINRS